MAHQRTDDHVITPKKAKSTFHSFKKYLSYSYLVMGMRDSVGLYMYLRTAVLESQEQASNPLEPQELKLGLWEP